MAENRNTFCDYLNYDGLEYYHRALELKIKQYIQQLFEEGQGCECSVQYGPTSHRPEGDRPGLPYFDTSLGFIIFWDGTKWVDSDGNPADGRHRGTTEQRDQIDINLLKFGYLYYNTDLDSFQIYNGNGWITLCTCSGELPDEDEIHWDHIVSENYIPSTTILSIDWYHTEDDSTSAVDNHNWISI